MTKLALSPVPIGTRWPSGESVNIALFSQSIEDLAARTNSAIVHGVEDGLGEWKAFGGRLPPGADIEIVFYLATKYAVVLRVDKNANYRDVLDEALTVFALSRQGLKSIFTRCVLTDISNIPRLVLSMFIECQFPQC